MRAVRTFGDYLRWESARRDGVLRDQRRQRLTDGPHVRSEGRAEAPANGLGLNVMMSGKSGFDICSELKGNEKRHRIPIILPAAVAKGTDLTEQDLIRKTSADDCLSKPFQSRELFTRIQKLPGD